MVRLLLLALSSVFATNVDKQIRNVKKMVARHVADGKIKHRRLDESDDDDDVVDSIAESCLDTTGTRACLLDECGVTLTDDDGDDDDGDDDDYYYDDGDGPSTCAEFQADTDSWAESCGAVDVTCPACASEFDTYVGCAFSGTAALIYGGECTVQCPSLRDGEDEHEDHGDEHEDEHADEDHGDEHGDEHADEDHGDEHGDEHADEDHGDEHEDHGDEHGDEHEDGDEHGHEDEHADEHDGHDHGDEDAGECRGPADCGCSGDTFCNFDGGSIGDCEGCLDSVDACNSDGLPAAGAADCVACCHGGESDGGESDAAAPNSMVGVGASLAAAAVAGAVLL